MTIKGAEYELCHGSVVIAAITSCTNTSNPAVMLAAGLVAKKAVERGLQSQPWVKTSLAPGSKVVTEYLKKSGLTQYLDLIGFNLVGYGCTTCIGNSGPLPPEISEAIREGNLAVAAVLSGNRNFEGRVHAEVRMNYLASPPLVVAYALAGRMDIDLTTEPLGNGPRRQAGLSQGSVAVAQGGPGRDRLDRGRGNVPPDLQRRLHGRRPLELARGRAQRSVRLGRQLDLHSPPALFHRNGRRA